MNHYEAKIEARKERLEARAEAAASRAQQLAAHASRLAEVIPFGQPILVGHHSEGRDRRYRAKISGTFSKACEASREADELARRAASVGTSGIWEDEGGAIPAVRINAEIQAAHQENFNAAWRQLNQFDKMDHSLQEQRAMELFMLSFISRPCAHLARKHYELLVQFTGRAYRGAARIQ